MRIKVYQVNGDLDSRRTKFLSYDSTLKTAGRVDPSIYKTVFDGNLDCENLEGVFDILNTNAPEAPRAIPSTPWPTAMCAVCAFRPGAEARCCM